jgi:hypothetical protein
MKLAGETLANAVTYGPATGFKGAGGEVTVTATYPYEIDLLGFVVASGPSIGVTPSGSRSGGSAASFSSTRERDQ